MKTTLILSLSILINFLAYAEDDDLREGNWDFLFNPDSLNIDFRAYNQQNAVICAKLSYLAYYITIEKILNMQNLSFKNIILPVMYRFNSLK